MESRVKFPKLRLTVTKQGGYCYHNYKVGDQLILDDFTHPPRHFCLGLAHSVFPPCYALTFGAKFPFEQNQRSIHTTCPDGGKLEFFTEVLDEAGNVEVVPKNPEHKGPNPKKIIISVEEVTGKCFHNYKVGDKWETMGLRTIPNFCGAAFHTLFPVLFALNFGAKFSFMQDENSLNTITCPDGGSIRFKATRVE